MGRVRGKRVPVEKLTEVLLRKYPVWEFCNDDEASETLVQPVEKLPITDAGGRLLACEFRLADGSTLFGDLSNLSLRSETQNQHFLTLSAFLDGKAQMLARYHDSWVKKDGPAPFAARFGKTVAEMFPISYDISAIAAGHATCVKGLIPARPKIRLSMNEIISLAVAGE